MPYARNMADHHLVTDLLPPVARLFFLGYLNGPAAGEASEGSQEGGLSLSMVQKALLLGVGLQHRSVDALAVELKLPVSQVLRHTAALPLHRLSELSYLALSRSGQLPKKVGRSGDEGVGRGDAEGCLIREAGRNTI